MSKVKKTFRIVSALYFTDQGQKEIPGIEGQGLYTGAEPNIAAQKVYTGVNKYLKKYQSDQWFVDFDENKPPKILFVMQDLNTGDLTAWYSWRVPAPQGVRILTGDDFRERTYKWKNKAKKAPLETVIEK